jgi:hypothetical protein
VQNILSSNFLSNNIEIYRTIILSVVLYGCETWLLTLGEVRRLRLFENRVLRRIFGPQRDEVTGEWRRLLTAYYSGDKNEKNEMGESCSTYGGEEKRIQSFDGET